MTGLALLLALWTPAHAGDWATVTLVEGFEVTLSRDGLVIDGFNRPHILWDSDHGVHHAMNDGGWSIEALPLESDSLSGVSAVAWGGEVATVWSQGGDLSWSTGSWGDWSPERVTNGFYLYGGYQPVAAVAPSGQLKMLSDRLSFSGDHFRVFRYDGVAGWTDLTTVDGEWAQLAFDSTSTAWYVWEDGADLVYSVDGWIEAMPPVVFPAFAAAQPFALVVDGQDRPTVGVQQGEAVMLYRLVGADWLTETIGLATPQARAPALDVDPSGAVHAVFIDDLTLEVRHAVETPTGWTTEVAHHEFPGELSIEATATQVHVAHVRDHTLRYGLRDDQGDWTWEELARTKRPGFGLSAVHDGSTVWIAHQEGGSTLNTLPQRLMLTATDGQTTEHHEVALPTDVLYQDTELALGTDGLLRLTRVDGAGYFWAPETWSGELTLMTGAPGSWSESDASRPEDAPMQHALALHPVTDEAVIAYLTPNPTLEGAFQLVLARQSGAAWTHEVLHEDAAYVDVQVGTDGTVHVGFRDQAASLARYLSDAGGTWTDTVVDDTNATADQGCGIQLQLALDPSDQPHFVYGCLEQDWENHAIWHAWQLAGQWDYDLVVSGRPRDLAVHVDDTATTFVAANTYGTVWLADDAGNHFSAEAIGAGGGDISLAMGPDGAVFVPWQEDDEWDLNLSLAQLDLDVQPAVVDFGSVPMTNTPEQQVTITNVGSTLVSLPLPELGGPHPFAFELLGVCGDLQPGDTCTWTVRFVPDAQRDRVATLTVAPGHEVVLTGSAHGVLVVDTSGCSDGCGSGGCATGSAPVLPWALVLAAIARRRRR